MTRVARAASASVLLAALAAPAAQAAWAPAPDILSVDNARREQSDGPNANADLAAGGRYLVFQTRATNFYADDDPDPAGYARQGGVFRADRTTGAIQLVADGDQATPDGTVQVRGALNPSVSADGRYVAFSTGQQLVPEDTNGNVDVYVRDMDVPLQADRKTGGAYTLVSALDGTNAPPSYEPTNPPASGVSSGTNLGPGAAISDDGRYVAFRTVELRSDLAGTGPLQTPAYTVFVRDLRERRTVLVSRATSDGSPVGGAEQPVVLSADGTTVAWVSTQAQDQTRFVPGEPTDQTADYYLWRRWADLGAVTRRPTGLADPDDPACPPSGPAPVGPSATGPCAGPLSDIEQGFNSISNRAPALSADGRTVAFLTGASARPAVETNPGLDLFVTDMTPGVSRKAGTRQITADSAAGSPQANGDVLGVALSEDGKHLAFTTLRTAFLLARPKLLGTPASPNSPADAYVVDLAADTMERAVFGPGGAAVNGTVLPGLSLAPDGSLLAFVTDASNLLVGDANGQPDAFVAKLAPPGTDPVPIPIRPRPPAPTPVAPPPAPAGLVARASSQKDGSVRLRVTAAQPGVLIVTVPPAGAGRSLVRLRKTFAAKGTQTLVLKLSDTSLVKVRRGTPLAAKATLVLTPAAPAKAQTKTVKVTFRVVAKKRHKKGKK